VAEPIIKKVIIKKEDLPAFNGATGEYSVRYRIVSEDKNRYSHWSPYYSVAVPMFPAVQCSVVVTNKVVNMVWQQPTGLAVKQYDIYFKTGTGPTAVWQYMATTTTTQFSTLIADTVSTLTVAVQIPAYPKAYSSSAAIFTSAPLAV
jgi:hypothetical protein